MSKTPITETEDRAEQEQPVSTTLDQELREAAERVYRHYGSDLGAFRRDVEKDMEKRDR